MCERIKRCSTCGKFLYRISMARKHICGYSYCSICKRDVKKEGMRNFMSDYDYHIQTIFCLGHLCYIQSLKHEDNASEMDDTTEDTYDEINQNKSISLISSKSTIKYRYVFFDFETMQDDIHKDEKDFLEYCHVPNLCITHVVCEDCKNIEINTNPEYICTLYGI